MALEQDDDERCLWFVTLTQSCNLRCVYCGSDDNFDMEDLSPHPRELSFDPSLLACLKRERPARPIVCFYGGEPLLRMELIARVMDEVLAPPFECDFVLQTNGLLLDRLSPERLARFSTILVSIDGDAATTDRNRGRGTYAKAVAQVQLLRERGFRGDVVARMTVGEWSTIDVDVAHLLDLGGGALFDHVHWQLDVLWDSPKFARWNDFLGWRDGSYNPGITRLCERFARRLSEDGVVEGVAPILGIAWSVLAKRPARHVRCSSGTRAFNITTGGLVTACPIAAECEPVGRLQPDGSFDPVSVHDSSHLGGDGRCERCEVFGECGGRCLYASQTSWWGDDGFDEVCVTVKHLVREVRRLVVPAAEAAIAAGRITLEQLHYPPFNNSVEVIP